MRIILEIEIKIIPKILNNSYKKPYFDPVNSAIDALSIVEAVYKK